ncbi:MAG TPA: AMP-binding protein [Steroidobacteraceae bacterium]
MQTLRLLAIDNLDAPIAQYRDAVVTAAQFVAQAEHVARAFPTASHVVNLSENRYHFLLGFVAACLREQVTLLPPGSTSDVLAKLRREYPDHHTLDDESIARLVAQAADSRTETIPSHWSVPASRVVAIAFTSGSTGASTPHPKTWRSLFHNSRLAAAEVLGGTNRSLVSTVPPQHMYGFEASLLSALTAQSFIHDGKPFFPADVRRALESMPAPRVLVTTPAHLKILADASAELPALHRVVSATAPLPVELARRIEESWQTELVEIYGCTEAGVMAHRRPSQSESWRTFEGGSMTTSGAAEYVAPQLDGPVPLQDVLELRSATEFLLRGRATDMIKVAGKRASLQDLTRQILDVPGVKDAVVFLPDDDARPAAAVVAPGVSAEAILHELRAHLDGVFVPRPLLVVDSLPRNAVGKLPREVLMQLIGRQPATTRVHDITIPATHASLAGHFPGQPIVPAVVLLEAVLAAVQSRDTVVLQSIAATKFLQPVLPDERIELRIQFSAIDPGRRRASFQGLREAALVFEGSFIVAEPAS